MWNSRIESLKRIMKSAGPVLLVLVATLLAYKFYMWNHWKVERAVAQARKIAAAQPAVNLAVTKDGKPLHRQSFAYNGDGNYYLTNRFDIGLFIEEDKKLTVSLELGRGPAVLAGLHRFEKYNIVLLDTGGERFYFVFTTRKCRMEDFIGLRAGIPRVIDSMNGD